MIALMLIAQMGFGFGLPQGEDLAPYRACVARVLTASTVEALRNGAALGPAQSECDHLSRDIMARRLDRIIDASARSEHPISRQEAQRTALMMARLGILAAIDDELRLRGIDPHPPDPRLPRLMIPRPDGKPCRLPGL